MSGRKILRRFSSSISDLLSIQKKGANDETDNGTALHSAVQMGNAVMAQSLLDNKIVWVDEEDGKGRTPLHYSMEQNSIELASLLLKAKANVDCVDFNGTSACHLACKDGMIDAFDLLLYYHADICAIDKSGKTPFDLACEFGMEKMIDRMLDCGVSWDSLQNAGETHKASSLHLAARNGHTHIVVRLLECGWNINKKNTMGSALHEAAGFGKAQVVRFLLHAGIDTTITNSSGLTALEYAKKNANRNPITIKEIRFLLKEHKSFVYGEAVREHVGIRADELSFSQGDIIWIIEKSADRRYKGIIFGQKANSRSGHFNGDAVKIVDKPKPIISMSTRMAPQPVAAPMGGPQQSRQAKKVCVPTVPGMANRKAMDINRNVGPAMSYHSINSPSRMSDDSQNGNNRSLRPSGYSAMNSTFSSYGTEPAHLLGTKQTGMTSLTFPSTSSLTMADPSHRISTGSNSSQGSSGFESMKSHGTASASSSSSSFHTPSHLTPNGHTEPPPSRISVHSSGSGGSGPSSLASCSVDALDESFYSNPTTTESSVNVTQMVAKGMPEAEILAMWLESVGMIEYLAIFLKQGYDLSSIARITPEDLLTLGVTNPNHRKKLIAEIHTWQITDSWPPVIPHGGLREWLSCLALPEYISTFEAQGYDTVQELMKLSWEDFDDLGVKRLGHLKRLALAIKKLKDVRRAQLIPSEYGAAQQRVHPVQVHSPMLSARTFEQSMQQQQHQLYSRHDPPPPAPSNGGFKGKPSHNGGIDYLSYTKNASYKPIPVPPMRALNDDYASYTDNRRRITKSTYDPIFDKPEPIRLNIVSTGKILSEVSREQDSASVMSGNIGGDCPPPPPAPLFCEGSIRRLQNIFHSSASSNGSTSSLEQLPFANENCGTIRSRDVTARTSTSLSQPQTPRKSIPMSLAELQEMNASERRSANTTGQDLSDLGLFMQSLTDELDAIAGSYAKTDSKQMPPSFPVSK